MELLINYVLGVAGVILFTVALMYGLLGVMRLPPRWQKVIGWIAAALLIGGLMTGGGGEFGGIYR